MNEIVDQMHDMRFQIYELMKDKAPKFQRDKVDKIHIENKTYFEIKPPKEESIVVKKKVFILEFLIVGGHFQKIRLYSKSRLLYVNSISCAHPFPGKSGEHHIFHQRKAVTFLRVEQLSLSLVITPSRKI